MNFLEHLNVIMRSNHSLINVVTYEETRLITMLAESSLFKDKNIIQWDLANGFKAIQGNISQLKKLERPDPLLCLREIEKSKVGTIFVLRDFHYHYRESIIIRAIRNLNYELQFTKKCIIIVTPMASLPMELREDVLQLELPLPTYEEIEKQLESIIALLPTMSLMNGLLKLFSKKNEASFKKEKYWNFFPYAKPSMILVALTT